MTWSLEHRLGLLANVVSARAFYAGPARWLTPALVATEAARDRLRAWCLAGGLDRPVPTVEEIFERAAFRGDSHIRAAVVLALEDMAPPARDYVLDHVATVGVGWTSAGFCSLSWPRVFDRVVVVTGDSKSAGAVRRMALHEFAHSWLEPDATFAPDAARAAERRELLVQGVDAVYTQTDVPIELRAWVLTEVWEGRPLGGETWHAIRKSFPPAPGEGQ